MMKPSTLALMLILLSQSGCFGPFDHGSTPDPSTVGVATLAVEDCVGCHQGTFEATTSPDHRLEGFTNNCAACHGTTAWAPSIFAHELWPLTGKHLETDCLACHKGKVYSGIASACVDCHQPQYDAATNPDHRALSFPTTCEKCHSTAGWRPAATDHTFWPLEGKHATTECTACHIDNIYAGTPTECVGCHKPQYDAATNPDHIASGFPTTCETCHSAVAWQPASFDHTTWPLEGKHATTDCASCHIGGVYAGTSRQCVGCHKPQYDATTNPDHIASGFPTTCETCHSPASWATNTFPQHNGLFPLSGKHGGLSCSTCHTSGQSFSQFSCVSGGCHGKARTDSKHIGEVSGYTYDSAACYRCHPNGREGDGGD